MCRLACKFTIDLISSGSEEGTSIFLAVAALAGITQITGSLRLKGVNKDLRTPAASSPPEPAVNEPQAILSKIDEAAKVGPALDAVIRHQLLLRGVTMGQKVPEDWERADSGKLVALSMRALNKSAYDPKAADLGFIFADSTPMNLGHLHA